MSGPVYDGDAHLAERLDAALADTTLRDTLSAARETTLAGHAGVLLRHPDWRERVARARAVRKDAIARCAELCDRFEERFTAQGGRVVRAATLDDAREAVVGIARERGVTLAVKGKSMVSEELELNEALAEAGVTPVETDLGEWVAQLAGERPSHLLAPIVHRSAARSPTCSSARPDTRSTTTRPSSWPSRAAACAPPSSRPGSASPAATSWSPRPARRS